MKKLNLIWVILFLLLFVCQMLYAEDTKAKRQPNSSSFVQFFKNIFDKINFATRVATIHDSNIFLAEDSENSDIITAFTQNLTLKLPKDKYYIELDYTGNISYYLEEGDNIYDHNAKFLYSYRPFDNFSFGIGNTFKKMHSKKIATAFGDRLLSRGYKEDSPVFEVKLEPTKKLTVDLGWQYYYLDADAAADDYIDRGDNIGNIILDYELWPKLITFIGYKYQDAHFPHLTTKDAKSNKGLFGFTKKFRSWNLTTEVGQEYKDTNFQSQDANTDFVIKLDSTYSAYTMLNFAFTFNRSEPSARKEYFQYFTNSFDAGLWHLINPKTSIATNFRYERQKFDSADVLSGNPYEDKTTDIFTFSTTLTRSLNDWLSLNLGYGFTKRNTDFAAEGYTDNRISLGLTAKY